MRARLLHEVAPNRHNRRFPIEIMFAKLREFQPIALRAEKVDLSLSAMIYFPAAVIHS